MKHHDGTKDSEKGGESSVTEEQQWQGESAITPPEA